VDHQALAADPDRHVPVDHEGDAPEHLLLSAAVLAAMSPRIRLARSSSQAIVAIIAHSILDGR
jgi:hypothetical protein